MKQKDWAPGRFALATIGGIWALYLLLIGLRLAALGVPHLAALELRHVATAFAGTVLNLALYRAIMLFDRRMLPVRMTVSLLLALLAGLLLSAANYAIMFLYAPDDLWSPAQQAHSTLVSISVQTFVEDFFLYAAWVTLYIAVTAAIGEQTAKASARDAQLRALNNQLNPHFLFNALNTVSALVIRGDIEPAERAIDALSGFLRLTLSLDPTKSVTLDEELRLQHDYLQIEQTRYGDRLSVSVDIPADLRSALVPPLLLQPLVENVIKHAVSRSMTPIGLHLKAAEVSGRLCLLVENDGPMAGKRGGGLGLSNVAERLALLHGDQVDFAFGPRLDGGFRVSLTIPLRR